jgi:two-component system, NtrC family, nitrogen regulation response regulator NtrX
MSKLNILIVDDEPDIRALLSEILIDEGYAVAQAEHADAARAQRRLSRPDLVLLDIWMPGTDGISLLREWSTGGLPFPVIMMSGHGNVETAVEATRLGAYDFIEKPLSLAKLLLVVKRALEADRLKQENLKFRQRLPTLSEPVGSGKTTQALKTQLERIAPHDTTVLFLGDAGVGKESFARFLHARSPRANRPFVELDAGAIAKENAARELFGHEDGALIHHGRLEAAHGGTLYIDELLDLDAELQLRLTSAIDKRQFVRVNGSQPVKIDVRVMAASAHDLPDAVSKGRLRQDLYYLLNVVPVKVPPLSERLEDLGELTQHFVDELSARDKLPYREFPIAAQNRLRQHGWPGNVRELKNLVQRLLIQGGEVAVSAEEIDVALGAPRAPSSANAGAGEIDLSLPLREAREQFEKRYLLKQLKAADGQMGKLARAVGLERTHLYRKLKALGIEAKADE